MRRAPQSPVLRNAARPLAAAKIAALRAGASGYGRASEARKKALLRDCAACAVVDAEVLLAYHDCLLFLLAYPGSAELLAVARRELKRVAAAARVITEAGTARDRARLANSGVAWTPTTIAFGYDIARWLALSYPDHADITSFDDAGAPLPDLLRHALPAMEFELLAAQLGEDLLAEASDGHRGSGLAWLVAQCERVPCTDAMREQLFDSLKAYITIRPRATALSRTFVRGLPAAPYFQRGELQRGIDPLAILAEPLAPPRALSRAERARLLDAGRAMLASLGRETDAISAAAAEGIEHHALGRGAAIALYTMVPGRRLPLDSHVGFMLFRNAVPVGYGGGWPFLGTAKIGVNIFAPFRGGESAYLFCQVLRVYRQRFGVGHFIAEPSQFGGGNREGLDLRRVLVLLPAGIPAGRSRPRRPGRGGVRSDSPGAGLSRTARGAAALHEIGHRTAHRRGRRRATILRPGRPLARGFGLDRQTFSR